MILSVKILKWHWHKNGSSEVVIVAKKLVGAQFTYLPIYQFYLLRTPPKSLPGSGPIIHTPASALIIIEGREIDTKKLEVIFIVSVKVRDIKRKKEC